MSLTLVPCEDASRWDTFVSGSPQGNVFCQTSFLDSLGVDYELWWVEESGEPRLGAIVLKDEAGHPLRAPFSFSLYQGVLFDQAHAQLQVHSRVKETLTVVDFLLTGLEQRYNCISFCLHHGVQDLRSFQWFHYHEPQRGQFTIELRYTGLLDLATVTDFGVYLADIRTLRWREYRRAQSEELTIETSNDLDTLERLHCLTFERQGMERSSEEKRLLRAISEAALSKGFGWLLLCRDKQGTAVSAVLFLYDSHCGYYLFGANDPEYRKTGAGTYLMLENIRRCKDKGLARVDFVGINSPNRGDFKTSFNAAPVPYFVVTWERPSYVA